MTSFKLSASDKHEIFVHAWEVSKPQKIVVIAHGMAEHGARYQELAKFLNQYTISVYALDHRGHGKSAKTNDDLGHFTSNPKENGWEKVISDLHNVIVHLEQLYPKVPLTLFGHSMGSFISLGFTIRYGKLLNTLILSGSNSAPSLLYKVARTIAMIECWRQGAFAKSQLLHFLSFGSFNKKFEPARTNFDWLSRDTKQVDLYINDPYCGFDVGNKLWVDLLGGLIEISDYKNLAKIPSNLPIYIFGGDKDPVGGFGKGLKQLNKELSSNELKNLTLKIYPEGRHEMINEINKEEVFTDIINWLKKV
jgi:alpha-beta hydrolase superfamily lysophospholipase